MSQEMSFKVDRLGTNHEVRIVKDSNGLISMYVEPSITGHKDVLFDLYFSKEEELEIKSTDLVKVNKSCFI